MPVEVHDHGPTHTAPPAPPFLPPLLRPGTHSRAIGSMSTAVRWSLLRSPRPEPPPAHPESPPPARRPLDRHPVEPAIRAIEGTPSASHTHRFLTRQPGPAVDRVHRMPQFVFASSPVFIARWNTSSRTTIRAPVFVAGGRPLRRRILNLRRENRRPSCAAANVDRRARRFHGLNDHDPACRRCAPPARHLVHELERRSVGGPATQRRVGVDDPDQPHVPEVEPRRSSACPSTHLRTSPCRIVPAR